MHSQLQTYLSFFDTDPKEDEIESYYQHAGPLMDAKYEKTSPHEVVSRQHHLSQHQQLQLQQALEKVMFCLTVLSDTTHIVRCILI